MDAIAYTRVCVYVCGGGDEKKKGEGARKSVDATAHTHARTHARTHAHTHSRTHTFRQTEKRKDIRLMIMSCGFCCNDSIVRKKCILHFL